MDAANLLKPMLARGELRCIGATTIGEYRQHMEKDAAFERRFQQVMSNSERLLPHTNLVACPSCLKTTILFVPQSGHLALQVQVEEPSVLDTIQILRGIAEKYASYHGVRISDRALVAAAELSTRYIQGRFCTLPFHPA
jgi:ATP-dependent Clp protease ATP-binding subunit ClpB